MFVFFFTDSDVDVLITQSEFNKISQESKELLCAACEMAQVRCAKLINIRAKVRGLIKRAGFCV